MGGGIRCWVYSGWCLSERQEPFTPADAAVDGYLSQEPPLIFSYQVYDKVINFENPIISRSNIFIPHFQVLINLLELCLPFLFFIAQQSHFCIVFKCSVQCFQLVLAASIVIGESLRDLRQITVFQELGVLLGCIIQVFYSI